MGSVAQDRAIHVLYVPNSWHMAIALHFDVFIWYLIYTIPLPSPIHSHIPFHPPPYHPWAIDYSIFRSIPFWVCNLRPNRKRSHCQRSGEIMVS
jgi:hypothetical protein